jgi:two-component system response regulator LytT
MILNCIAVDDEPLALDMICSYIEQTPSLNLIGRYSGSVDALKGIHAKDIDLIFLDIRMPDLSGIELARILEQYRVKGNMRVVFTTAFDQYALEGFKVDALDYLLKPFSFVDFSKTVTKALSYFELIRNPGAHPVVKAEGPKEQETKYLYLKVEHQLMRIALDDIIYIEGLKDYVKVYLLSESKAVLSLISMKTLEEKLPADKFMRIHRSFIVSLDKIKATNKKSIQIAQATIPVTDQYKEVFNKFIENWS